MAGSGHVFISYPHTETQFTARLAADLRNAGVRIWMDILEGGIKSGDDWRRGIADGVDGSVAIISVLCPDYIKSDYCRKELARADRMKRKMFPVLLRSIPEARDWPIEVESIQYTDFRDWQDERVYLERFTALVQELKARAAEQIGAVPDAETQYLTSLIAELESRKGVLEYVELTAQADAPERPNPHRDTSGWDASFAIITEQSVGTRRAVSALEATPQKIPLSNIAEALEKYPRFVLIGEPGAGKTTTLRRLALDAARKRLEDQSAPLPVLLYLPTWGNEPTHADFIHAQMQKTGLVGTRYIVSTPDGTDIHLYLDGLNEMGAAGVEKAKKLRDWLHGGDAPQHIIITCREGDYVGDLDLNLPTVLAEEMKEPQIRQFAKNYLGEEGVTKFLIRVLPEYEWQRERDSNHLFRLARNPYLLAALIFVYTSSPDGDLPRNTGALMRMLARALWERERQRGTPGWIPFEEMEAAFARLAFAMIDQDMPIDVPLYYVMSYLGHRNYALLLAGRDANIVEVRGNVVRFYHQLMQEYFAAVELEKVGIEEVLEPPDFEGGEMGDYERLADKWDESIYALYGIVNEPETLLCTVAEIDPWLAGSITGGFYDKIINECLLSLLSDGDEEIRAAAVGTLAEKRGFEVLSDLLWVLREDPDSEVREAAAWGLGKIRNKDAVTELVEALDDEDEQVRAAVIWALGEIGDSHAVPDLLKFLHDNDLASRIMVIEALGKIKDKRAAPHLLAILRESNSQLRQVTLINLGFLKDARSIRDIAEVMKNDQDPILRRDAARALGMIEDVSAVPHLIDSLRDEVNISDEWGQMLLPIFAERVSDVAAEAVERIGTPEALEAVARWRAGQEGSNE